MHGAPPSYKLVLISCSYEFMRKKLIFYRTEIHRRTGKVRLSKLDSGVVNPVKMVGRGFWSLWCLFWGFAHFVFTGSIRTVRNIRRNTLPGQQRSAGYTQRYLIPVNQHPLFTLLFWLTLQVTPRWMKAGIITNTFFLFFFWVVQFYKCCELIRDPERWIIWYLCHYRPENTGF